MRAGTFCLSVRILSWRIFPWHPSANVASVDDAIERCVAAGLAARRASDAAAALRAQAEHRKLTFDEDKRLAELENDSLRLSKAFVAAQGPLSEAAPIRFQQNLAQVTWRIEQQLAREG
jgi:hypothetical protein